MKQLFAVFLAIFSIFCSTSAQDFSLNWKSHFAYTDFVDVFATEDKIYVASLKSIFVHDVTQNSNKEYTTVEGLSGEDISVLHYSEDYGLIVIGYETGLLEIIDESTGEITSFVDIEGQSLYPSDALRINDIKEENGLIYIATGFGVVEFNLETHFFEETYLVSDSSVDLTNVQAIGVLNDVIYISVEGEGVYYGDKLNSNLLFASSWTNSQAEEFTQIETLSGNLIAHLNSTQVYELNENIFSSIYANDNAIIDFKVNAMDQLTLTSSSVSTVLNSEYEFVAVIDQDENVEFNDNIPISVYTSNELYFSFSGNAFFKTQGTNFSRTQMVSPQGPLMNYAYGIDAYDGELWITHGEVSRSFTVNNLTYTGISHSSSGIWGNVPYEEVTGVADIVNVTIDREDKNHVYFSAFFGGLLEYQDGVFEIYNSSNSNIEDDFVTGNTELRVTLDKVFNCAIDSEGELWILNNRTYNPLKQFSFDPDDESATADISDALNQSVDSPISFNLWDLEVYEDYIFLGSYNKGLIAYDRTTENSYALFDNTSNNMPALTVRSLAQDLNGELWLGTTYGLRRFTNPINIFQLGTSAQAESIIFLDDGVAQELLFQQVVTDIKVDADNKKWIATADNGVYYVSSDGQETIYNFTTANSPLPSNVVNQIAIDEVTGAVYFATDAGVVEFDSNITEAVTDLNSVKVFPNPVRPEYNDILVTVQGLTAGANVKFTDIEGNLVYEAQNDTYSEDGSGTVQWDTKTFEGRSVSSGVYLVLITDKDGVETAIEKLLIIR